MNAVSLFALIMDPTSSFPRKDPIWDTPVIEMRSTESQWTKEYNSPRCGGWYSIDIIAIRQMNDLSDRQKARLTSQLIKKRENGNRCPEVTRDMIELVKQQKDISEFDPADRIFRYIKLKIDEPGGKYYFSYDPDDPLALSIYDSTTEDKQKDHYKYYELVAYSGCTSQEELEEYLKDLDEKGLIEFNPLPSGDRGITIGLTVKGKRT